MEEFDGARPRIPAAIQDTGVVAIGRRLDACSVVAVAAVAAARAELAARYQLVTPFSGAVVLETQQQYADHGLTPADGDATPKVPSVPETPQPVKALAVS